MGDSFHQQQQQQTTRQSNSRLGLRQTGGEIVEVQGGHIVRSTGRKDRHSKVCTAKGPRDRRVRLSAHTAIEFYDVQDRLGYDRPSKAVDWLIKKAKAAIDELEELPAWTPTAGTTLANNSNQQESGNNQQNPIQQISVNHHGDLLGSISGGCSSSKRAMTNMHHNSGNSSSFLPPSLDSDSIADTIKSFFPMGASNEANSSGMQFQSQDLRLSLQSFQDPIMLHHHHSQQQQQSQHHHNALFSGATQLGFDASGWSSDHHQQQQSAEIGRFQRLASWNAGGDGSTSGGAPAAGGGGYLFNSQPAPPPQPLLQQLFGQNQLFSQQRGPLQSSNTPSIRAWMDPSSAITIATADHHHNHIQNQHHHAAVLPIYPSGIGFASGIGGFPGFHIPARIQGEEEEHDGLSDKPSSASSDSRH